MLVKSHNETNSLADMVTWFCEMQMSGDVHGAGRPLLDVARQAGAQVDRCPPAAVTLTFTGHSSKLETAFAKDGESARSERTGWGKHRSLWATPPTRLTGLAPARLRACCFTGGQLGCQWLRWTGPTT